MYPNDLLYTQSHEWVRIEDGIATIGITFFAQEQLGDLTFVELPEVGTMVEAGDEIGSVESVKAASEIYSPISGKIASVNDSLENAPERVNDDPYGEGWIIKITIADEPQDLMRSDEYEELIAEDNH